MLFLLLFMLILMLMSLSTVYTFIMRVYIHPLHTFVTVYTRIRMPGYILIELILVFVCYNFIELTAAEATLVGCYPTLFMKPAD